MKDRSPDGTANWIVPDWGAIRALPSDYQAPSEAVWVLCDHTFLEPLHNEGDSPGLLAKFRRVLDASRMSQRILVARSWQDISQGEVMPRDRTRKSAIVDTPTTEALRLDLEAGTLWKRLEEARTSAGSVEYKREKDYFVRCGNEFANAAINRTSQIAAMIQRDAEFRYSWIQRPELPCEFLSSEWRGKPTPRLLKAALRRFPDRKALGRWVRLTAYYALERLAKPDQKDERFGNNFEDARYAFLASYVGQLASNDLGLQKCVRTLFPWVSFVSLREVGGASTARPRDGPLPPDAAG